MEHLCFKIAWRDNGWFGGLCSNPRIDAPCTGFEFVRDMMNKYGVCGRRKHIQFYCVDEHAAFSMWWVRIHNGVEPKRLVPDRSLVFLVTLHPYLRKLTLAGVYLFKSTDVDTKYITIGATGTKCVIIADKEYSCFLNPDLYVLPDEIQQRLRRYLLYIDDKMAARVLSEALAVHVKWIFDGLKPKWSKWVSRFELDTWIQQVRKLWMLLDLMLRILSTCTRDKQ